MQRILRMYIRIPLTISSFNMNWNFVHLVYLSQCCEFTFCIYHFDCWLTSSLMCSYLFYRDEIILMYERCYCLCSSCTAAHFFRNAANEKEIFSAIWLKWIGIALIFSSNLHKREKKEVGIKCWFICKRASCRLNIRLSGWLNRMDGTALNVYKKCKIITWNTMMVNNLSFCFCSFTTVAILVFARHTFARPVEMLLSNYRESFNTPK